VRTSKIVHALPRVIVISVSALLALLDLRTVPVAYWEAAQGAPAETRAQERVRRPTDLGVTRGDVAQGVQASSAENPVPIWHVSGMTRRFPQDITANVQVTGVHERTCRHVRNVEVGGSSPLTSTSQPASQARAGPGQAKRQLSLLRGHLRPRVEATASSRERPLLATACGTCVARRSAVTNPTTDDPARRESSCAPSYGRE